MERFIRVGVTLIIVTIACILAIITANGKITWATAGLVAIIVLTAGLAAGVWAVVHGHFSSNIEIGLTIGIIVGIIVGGWLLLVGGTEIKRAFENVFADVSAWWLIWPVAATAALSFLLDLHRNRRPGRR